MSKVFLDTNIIVWANDGRDRPKQQRAMDLVASCLRDGSGVISTQVLQEYAVVALGKLGQQLEIILQQLQVLETLQIVQITPELVRRGLELHARYRIPYWDAAILAAAEHAKCNRLWSEDFSAGTLYATVRVEDPFAD